MTSTSFSSLGLSPAMLASLQSRDYQAMTAIQTQSLPIILDGRDVIAQAETGSGKTVAFGIGLLSRLQARSRAVQALVLCPTRELADQVGKEIRRLASFIPNIKLLTLCGGAPIGPQFGSLAHGAHIIVGTPGRVLKHIHKNSLNLERLNTLVLDEADRMLDMGFYDDIAQIAAAAPTARQTLLFSATYPDAIEQVSASVQKQPQRISVTAQHSRNNIEQLFFAVNSKEQRMDALLKVLGHYQPASCVIFCNTKQQCQSVADLLKLKGIDALALHGDLEQRDRNQVLVQFSNRSCCVLVATDVAARGLDIKDLELVVNYELSQDPQVHIHRIGRTGRAGNSGCAISLYIPSEALKVNAIETCENSKIQHSELKDLHINQKSRRRPSMVTLCIDGGRRNKLRPGDILGALTSTVHISGDQVGKIDIFDNQAYVAVEAGFAQQALKLISQGKIKGRYYKVRSLKV